MRSIRPVLLPSSFLFAVTGYCTSGLAGDLPSGALGSSLVVTFLFHVGGYLMNDLLDIRIDRTDASRRTEPISGGSISPRTVAGVVVAVYLLAATICALLCPLRFQLCFVLAVACTAAYNLYGKSCRIPPATDFVQGLAWAFLLVACGSWNGLHASTVLVGLALALYLTMVNGFQGALRDRRNDAEHRARTTATVHAIGKAKTADKLAAGYVTYGVVLTVVKTMMLVGGVLLATSGSSRATSSTGPIAAVLVFETAGTALFLAAVRNYDRGRSGTRLGFAQLLMFPLGLQSIIWISLGPVIYGITMAAYLAPWLGSRTVRSLAAPITAVPSKVSSG